MNVAIKEIKNNALYNLLEFFIFIDSIIQKPNAGITRLLLCKPS
ncbi:hypothetical protein VCHA35O141_120015 [Vibrio chagasii]|nr:hypothetical protein VCHA35O141_120015 [Vibrio chagasii]CAH6840194.1 hypothetical protein VCHA35O143_10141 [Vibrio chagasii]CAH6842112.1 hypothetical protein VCHA31O73_10349 [Vibrio chagasii]CAH7064696.1 hypothetical protein VCHA53O480_10325 [Vibrio chagasii]